MHPSAPGSGVSGASKPLQHAPNSARGSSNADAFIQDGATQAWYYSTSGASVDNNKGNQHLASTSSAPMITTPSFYNSDDPSVQQQRESQRQYQQWIEDNYNGQQPAQQVAFQQSYRSAPLPAAFEQDAQAIGGLDGINDTDPYRAHADDIYSTFYSNLLSVSNSPASTPGGGTSYHTSTSETMGSSHTNTPDPVYQQQLQNQQQHHQQQQHQQPRQTSERFVPQAIHQAPVYAASQVQQQKPNNSTLQDSSRYTRALPARYIPPRNQANPGPVPQQPFQPNPTESRPSTLSPPAKTWNNEVYQSQNPKSATMAVHQFVPPTTSNQVNPAGPSKSKPMTTAPLKRPTNAEPPPAPNASSSQPEKAGVKRKRVKKNESPDVDDDDDDDETGLGMSGRMTVGLGGLGVPTGRGKREKGSRL
ncbi:hypothetical protein BJ912DRAFT_954814 [Pholiota molesta]|nr:hypothetical protein BJ912DRAFT_954814 [Pholiota molesta]